VLYDFHTHSFLSDGVLSPIELIRRAVVRGYSAIAITDHVGIGSLSRVIKEVSDDCAFARAYWNILAIPGVELTHIPAKAIAEVAQKAKELGAWLVVVHGETLAEPVESGTNFAALQSPHVDILAHPGLLTPEQAALAAERNIFIELTTRNGHSATNAHVASVCLQAQAPLLLNSDAHTEGDLLSPVLVTTTLLAAGLGTEQRTIILEQNPLLLLQRLNRYLSASA
jgi:histidinol phosphatase-like PHP family hydrolase